MNYREQKPTAKYSEYVESIWQLESHRQNEVYHVIPELIFDILVVRTPLQIRFEAREQWTRLERGVYFMGLFDKLISLKFPQGCNVFGIRIKPFALSHLKYMPLKYCQNRIYPISKIFECSNTEIYNDLLQCTNYSESYNLAIESIETEIKTKHTINDSIREMTNYIMTQKGLIKNPEIYDKFGITKETLRNLFLAKMGIRPKSFIKIMRMNYALEQQHLFNNMNLTDLAYIAGYFDQSHFIKDFKSIFFCTPKLFLKEKYTIQESSERIHRRFSSYYAPEF